MPIPLLDYANSNLSHNRVGDSHIVLDATQKPPNTVECLRSLSVHKPGLLTSRLWHCVSTRVNALTSSTLHATRVRARTEFCASPFIER